MTFTYRLDSSDTTEVAIAAVRLEVGDNDDDRGIKPDGANYTDEEIAYILAQEDDIVGRAAARICEQMATAWASVPRTMFGSLFDPRAITRNFRFRAAELRKEYGKTTETGAAFAIATKRAGT
jgi:hypothetical protein